MCLTDYDTQVKTNNLHLQVFFCTFHKSGSLMIQVAIGEDVWLGC